MRRVLFLILPPIVSALCFWAGLHLGSEGDVRPFNDGFYDSKYDDCQQGFQPACDWLATTK